MFYLIIQQLPKPDLLVYLYLDIDKLQQNIQKRGRPYEQSIKDEYLEGIQKSYFDFIRQQKDQRVLVINTNDLDFVKRPGDYERIKEIIDQEYDEGVHHIDP